MEEVSVEMSASDANCQILPLKFQVFIETLHKVSTKFGRFLHNAGTYLPK
jgi:hypothetical protein